MHKKSLRIPSLVLAMILTMTIVPPIRTTAVPTTKNEVEQQIIHTYKRARSLFGRSSFDGCCGALTTAQIYLLGITNELVGGNGNDQYDAYCRQSVTSGGYRVKAYPAAQYSLRQALNAITRNGTQDAYHILVGFQKTRSTSGQRYGHACVIHAIIDGQVYFMESYDASINGVRYREGTPIRCTIDAFVDHYAGTTTQLDGVIHFGPMDYAGQCKFYPSNFAAKTTAEVSLWSQPCENHVDDCASKIGSLAAGQMLIIQGLYLNTEGEYWYQVAGEPTAFVRADHIEKNQLFFDDVTVKDVSAPTVLQRGRTFDIKGTATGQFNSIYTIRAQVYRMDGDDWTQVINTTDLVEGKNYVLSKSAISKNLTFRKLPVGQYRYELAAVVGNHYIEDGQIQIGWETVALWSADFQVVEGTTHADTITFDACGGTAALDQTAVAVGDCVGSLPLAQRSGYVFLGWFTQITGGQRVSTDFIPNGDVTLYAQWISVQELQESWKDSGKCWALYSDGLTTMGCIQIDGMLYHFSSVDSLGQTWTLWTASGTV